MKIIIIDNNIKWLKSSLRIIKEALFETLEIEIITFKGY